MLFKLPRAISVIFSLFKSYIFLSILLATSFSMSFLFLGLDHFLSSYASDNYETMRKFGILSIRIIIIFLQMPVSLAQWRMEIGYFSNCSSKHLRPNILPNTVDISYKSPFSQFVSIILFCVYFILSMSIVYAKFYFAIFFSK